MSTHQPDDYCRETDPFAKPPEPEAIIAELTGKRIRKLNPKRMLQTGDMLINEHGQKIFEVIAFHPQGVRVRVGIVDYLATYTWAQIYGFFEEVPETEPAPSEAP